MERLKRKITPGGRLTTFADQLRTVNHEIAYVKGDWHCF
jgi:hypothetical protein